MDADRAYVACGHLRAYDVTDLGSPALLGLYFPLAAEVLNRVVVANGLAYVSTADPAGLTGYLRIVDVADPSVMVEFGFTQHPGQIRGLQVRDSFVFAAEGYRGLQVVNVQSPTALSSPARTLAPALRKGSLCRELSRTLLTTGPSLRWS